MTTDEMLRALTNSDNRLCALRAKAVVDGQMTIQEALDQSPGSFMTAVLKGDYQSALRNADGNNLKALNSWKLTH